MLGAWLAPLDAPATAQVDAGLKRALVSFATARALNGVISVAQGTDQLWQKFLAADYSASQQVIDNATGAVAQLNPPEPQAINQGWLTDMKNWFAQNGDVKARFERLKQAAEQATEHIIKLIVIFLLQTLVIPLFLMWALVALARAAVIRHLP